MPVDTSLPEVAVEDIQLGDAVDLQSSPYLSDHPSAEFELAEVDFIERESVDTICIGFANIDNVGYQVGTKLRVQKGRRTKCSKCGCVINPALGGLPPGETNELEGTEEEPAAPGDKDDVCLRCDPGFGD